MACPRGIVYVKVWIKELFHSQQVIKCFITLNKYFIFDNVVEYGNLQRYWRVNNAEYTFNQSNCRKMKCTREYEK